MNNKYLYISDEQHPIYQIFNEKIDSIPKSRTTKRSKSTYTGNNEGIR